MVSSPARLTPLLALFIEQSSFLGEIFGEFSYAAPAAVLLLCGIGLPLPEEVTLIGSGLLLYEGKVEFVPITLVCSLAILAGDSIPYWLGRRYGMSAIRLPWVAKLVHPERFARLQQRFEEHGNWATFACRFFAGVRIPGYFVAGTMRMSFPRFLILDTLGVLISVPVSIYAGKVFGDQVERLHHTIGNLHLILAFLVVALSLILFLRSRKSRRRRKAEARARSEEALGHPPESEATSKSGVRAAMSESSSPGEVHPGPESGPSERTSGADPNGASSDEGRA